MFADHFMRIRLKTITENQFFMGFNRKATSFCYEFLPLVFI